MWERRDIVANCARARLVLSLGDVRDREALARAKELAAFMHLAARWAKAVLVQARYTMSAERPASIARWWCCEQHRTT